MSSRITLTRSLPCARRVEKEGGERERGEGGGERERGEGRGRGKWRGYLTIQSQMMAIESATINMDELNNGVGWEVGDILFILF